MGISRQNAGIRGNMEIAIQCVIRPAVVNSTMVCINPTETCIIVIYCVERKLEPENIRDISN